MSDQSSVPQIPTDPQKEAEARRLEMRRKEFEADQAAEQRRQTLAVQRAIAAARLKSDKRVQDLYQEITTERNTEIAQILTFLDAEEQQSHRRAADLHAEWETQVFQPLQSRVAAALQEMSPAERTRRNNQAFEEYLKHAHGTAESSRLQSGVVIGSRRINISDLDDPLTRSTRAMDAERRMYEHAMPEPGARQMIDPCDYGPKFNGTRYAERPKRGLSELARKHLVGENPITSHDELPQIMREIPERQAPPRPEWLPDDAGK